MHLPFPSRRPSAPARWGSCLALLTVLAFPGSIGAQSAVTPDPALAGPSPVFQNSLERKRDAETLLTLAAEGRNLYERDLIKLDGYAYCGQAHALAEQGEFRQSIRAASKALHLGQAQGDAALRATAHRDLAIAYSYAGQLDLAEENARRALELPGVNPQQVLAPAHKVIGDIRVRQGRLDEAVAAYNQSLALSSQRYRPLVLVSLANAQTSAGRPAQAVELLGGVTAEDQGPILSFFLRSRANAYLALGRHDEALADFQRVAQDAQRPDSEYHRLWAFEGIGRVRLAQGQAAPALAAYLEAASLAERLRARFRSDEFKTGLFSDVQSVFDTALDLSVRQRDFRSAWRLSEGSRARQLLDTVRDRASDTLSELTTLDALQAALGPDEAVLQYHVVGEYTVVWLIRRASVTGERLPVTADSLQGAVEAFRDAIVNRHPTVVGLGQGLYEQLVRPVLAGSVGRLYVVPHGALHYMPFQALHTGQGYLIQSQAMVVWPSSAVGMQLLARQASKAPALLAFGNPTTPTSVPLPAAEREVGNLSRLFTSNRVFLRDDATKARFKQEAGRTAVLHVAAHAEVDAIDPLFSRILFASDGRDPGLLEAREIFRLNLQDVDLVTLSACESGLGAVARGDEIVGFTRSFLSAGANSIIASLWPVADQSTELLMNKLYQELVAGKDLMAAMQLAQLEVQRNRRFAHPFFWAPFNVIGNGRLTLGS